MGVKEIIKSFSEDLLSNDREGLMKYFADNAVVNIHNINKAMTAEEYVNTVCKHKEEWNGEIVRLVVMTDLSVVVTKINTSDKNLSYNVVGFMTFEGDKITNIEEYWAENGKMPMWE